MHNCGKWSGRVVPVTFDRYRYEQGQGGLITCIRNYYMRVCVAKDHVQAERGFRKYSSNKN